VLVERCSMLKTPALQPPANVQSKRQIWNTLLAMCPRIIYICLWMCLLQLGDRWNPLSLFFICLFAQACWIRMNIVLMETDPLLAVEEIKEQINLPFLMDTIIIFCWSLWMQRNDIIFRGIQPTPDRCLQFFRKEWDLPLPFLQKKGLFIY